MSDLIDRQATLKLIEKIQQSVQMMDDTHKASIIMDGMDLCEEAVRNQPAAQSKIIRCKDCKHHIDEKPGMVYCPEIMGGWVKDDSFCAVWDGGKRKQTKKPTNCPNCGAVLEGFECEYCGTTFYDFASVNIDEKPGMVKNERFN